MLTSHIRIRHPLKAVPDAEDIFSSSIGLLFTDDLCTQHGEPGAQIIYRSRYGDIELNVADPQREEERTKFAHYLWNAGVLMSELISEPRDVGRIGRDESFGGYVSVKGESVLELGAGVLKERSEHGYMWSNL